MSTKITTIHAVTQDLASLDVKDKQDPTNESGSEDDDDGEAEVGDATQTGDLTGKKKKKKKKKKPKSKKKDAAPIIGGVAPELPAPPAESPEETAKWMKELRKGAEPLQTGMPGVYDAWFHNKEALKIFWTPSCRELKLTTARLELRPVITDDLRAIQKIKQEPQVQKTQMYGAPSANEIREYFIPRYIRFSIPGLEYDSPRRANLCRETYQFAITLKDPTATELNPQTGIRMGSRLTIAEGYMGNIALQLNVDTEKAKVHSIVPTSGKVFTYPSFEDCDKVELTGTLFYELHPQLWGKGIMSEAFSEALRFAFEEVGCLKVIGNEASIKLCLKNGMKYTHKVAHPMYGKIQLFHSLSREEWWKANRPGKEVKGAWTGKPICRWCQNLHQAPTTIICEHCNWGNYCSRECQRADWLKQAPGHGGHQADCKPIS